VSCNIDALHDDWMNILQKKQIETLINGCRAEPAIMLNQAPKSLEQSTVLCSTMRGCRQLIQPLVVITANALFPSIWTCPGSKLDN
jgi:hypothetical protein